METQFCLWLGFYQIQQRGARCFSFSCVLPCNNQTKNTNFTALFIGSDFQQSLRYELCRRCIANESKHRRILAQPEQPQCLSLQPPLSGASPRAAPGPLLAMSISLVTWELSETQENSEGKGGVTSVSLPADVAAKSQSSGSWQSYQCSAVGIVSDGLGCEARSGIPLVS